MGNIIKSRLELLPEFNEPEGHEHWRNIKSEFIQKYGNNEDKATQEIVKEIGLPEEIHQMLGHFSLSRACLYKEEKDYIKNILNYADWRVSPYGIVSFEERMDEAKMRYKKTEEEEKKREILIQCGREIEKQIFAKCKIRPEDINNQTVAPIVRELRNFVIK